MTLEKNCIILYDDDNSLFLKFKCKFKYKASSFHSFRPNKNNKKKILNTKMR